VPNGHSFIQEMLKGYRQHVLDAARRVRPDVREVHFTAGGGVPETGGPATSHPAVQAAVELFDGEVTGVRPAARGERRGTAEPDTTSPENGEHT
jgi:hypothetical protein